METRETIQEFVKNVSNNLSPKLSLKDAETIKLKLDFLAKNFDPYAPHFNDEIENILQEFDLQDKTENPFTFTNILLKYLDSIDNALKA